MIQLTINIDEKMFDESLGKTLQEMKPEELKDVITECIKQYFLTNNENIEKLLYEKRDTYYGGYTLGPSIFTEKLIQNLDYSGLQEIADKCIEDLKKHYKDIIEKVLLEMMVEGLTDTYSFNDKVRQTMSDIMYSVNRSKNT